MPNNIFGHFRPSTSPHGTKGDIFLKISAIVLMKISAIALMKISAIALMKMAAIVLMIATKCLTGKLDH